MRYTLKELQAYKVLDVQEGRDVAEEILQEQLKVHQAQRGLEDNIEWQRLSDIHYDLRQVRRRILNDTGKLAMKLKRAKV